VLKFHACLLSLWLLQGFVHIFYAKEEWENFVSDEDKAKVNKVKLVLYLNRALCKIKLAKIEDALWDCDQARVLTIQLLERVSLTSNRCKQAITLDSKNSKGHFRRGLVFTEKLKGELEKEKKGEFWIVDKGFEYAKEAEKSLEKAQDLIGDVNDRKMLHALADLKRSHVRATSACFRAAISLSHLRRSWYPFRPCSPSTRTSTKRTRRSCTRRRSSTGWRPKTRSWRSRRS
jgi:hypothetical protein